LKNLIITYYTEKISSLISKTDIEVLSRRYAHPATEERITRVKLVNFNLDDWSEEGENNNKESLPFDYNKEA
jgi:hypothetical protein